MGGLPRSLRCFQPSTASRRLSVVVGFYRVCVIDLALSRAPTDDVRRPLVRACGSRRWALPRAIRRHGRLWRRIEPVRK